VKSNSGEAALRVLSLVSGLVCIVAPLHASAVADTLPPVYVFTEGDNSGMNQCQIDTTSATASAEAALRYNQVPLAQHDDYIKDHALEFSVEINSFEITRESGSGTGSCAINAAVYLGTFTKTFDPARNNIKFGTIHYCDKETLFVVNKFTAQRSINDQISQYINECVSAYQGLKVLQ
jgi:hypothetical protein